MMMLMLAKPKINSASLTTHQSNQATPQKHVLTSSNSTQWEASWIPAPKLTTKMIALMINIASGTNALKAMVETYSHVSLKTSHSASKRTEVSTQEHAAMMKIRSSSVYQTSRKTRETKTLSRLASFKTTKRTAPVTSSASGKVKRPNATTLLDGLPVSLDSHAQSLLKDTARMEKSKKSSSSLLDLKSTIQLITAVNVVRRSTNQ